MRCAACDAECGSDARYCSACGTPLRHVCAGCGHANESDARFCSACGGRLADELPAPRDADVAREGERRQLTVLFCDVVGSTALAARLDPEDWYAVAAQFQRCGAQAVERFGGHIAQFLGDGFFTYFGYPTAHDDDPERAVRAAIAVLDALERLNGELAREHGVRLAVRIGIHTGEVVLGQGGGADTDVFGETVHLTARLQHLAAPDEIIVTDATSALVRGLFLTEERGVHRVPGFAKPVTLSRVLRPTGVRGRLHSAAARGLTPFVGRDAERSLLHSRWERACESHGQVVFVSGEPGIGKSRLVQVFRGEIAGPHTWIECASSPYHERTPFFCVIEAIQQALVQQCGEAPDEQLAMLERSLAASGVDPAPGVRLVAELIGLTPPDDRYPPVPGDPAERRHRLMAAIVQWIVGAAVVQPVVIVVEDLMWADPSTVELLDVLVQQAATAPLFLVLTARPEFQCPWPVRSNVLTVTLNRLGRRQVREMITSGASASAELLEVLAERSDGVPLFAEELALLVNDATGRFGRTEIPATLHDLLAARLDRVGSARRIAQIGAVIGREFSYDLVAAVAGGVVPDLDAALARLASAELVHVRGFPPDATYVFKHALVRDAAYESLLRSRRRELHVAIAHALERRASDAGDAPAELLAHHYTEAGELDVAWRAWRRAGELAVARSALREAADLFATALRLLETLPDGPERAQPALELQVLLGQALAATKGYGARDVTDAFARARELAQQVGATPEIRSVLFGLWSSIAGKGELRMAEELAEELLVVAERSGVESERVWGHLARGINRYSRGEAVTAREDLDRVLALYRKEERPWGPSDPGVMARSYAAVNSWVLGLVDEARTHGREALRLARDLGNPFAEAWAGFFVGALHVFLREPERALALCDRLIPMCREHDFPLFVGLVTIVRGAALSEAGRHADACAELRTGLDLYSATGQRIAHRLYLSWLVEACLGAGRLDEAAAVVEEALAMAPDQRLFEPEQHRQRAEILALRGADPARIDAAYRDAVELARRQGARTLELRAATSWVRWRRGTGPSEEARARLADVCGWFPEAVDLRDLAEARAMLHDEPRRPDAP